MEETTEKPYGNMVEIDIKQPEVEVVEGECKRSHLPKHPLWLLFLLVMKLLLNFRVRRVGIRKSGRAHRTPEAGFFSLVSKRSKCISKDMAETNHVDAGKGDAAHVWVRINLPYFRTTPGMVKLLQLLLGIICMACASPALLTGTHWFLFVAVMSFIATLIWVFIYLLSIKEALSLPINWILTEVLNTGIITVLYFIAFIVQLSVWSSWSGTVYKSPNIAAGVFGIFNTLAYAFGTYLLYAEWKASTSQ